MNFAFPNQTEIADLIDQLENFEILKFPKGFDLDKAELTNMLEEAYKILIEEFPNEGYSPLPFFTEKGERIENSSTVKLVLNSPGELPVFHVTTNRNNGCKCFDGVYYFELDLGNFVAFSFTFWDLIMKNDLELTDEELKRIIPKNCCKPYETSN